MRKLFKLLFSILIILFTLVFLNFLTAFKETNFVFENNDKNILQKKSPLIASTIKLLQLGEDQIGLFKQAPILWWHPDEKNKATDPLWVYRHSSLVYTEVYPFFVFANKKKVDLTTNNLEINYEDQNPQLNISRLFESNGIKKGLAGFYLNFKKKAHSNWPSTLVWRLGNLDYFADIQPNLPNEILIPIEYWYFSMDNPIPFYVGSHQADWESFLILYKFSDQNNLPLLQPIYLYTSAHMGGHWHCYKDLTKTKENKLELFSALNTHATYTEAKTHLRIYPDQTAYGESWDTTKSLRPLVKESYYKFKGGWGVSHLNHTMSGPLAPSENLKYLPAAGKASIDGNLKPLILNCLN